MGIQSAVGRSINVAANFMFKLHIAALESKTASISLYPVMDGVYACAPNELEMAVFLRAMLKALTDLFISEKKQIFQFIVRAAVAKGEVHHGRDVGRDASVTLARNPEYRGQILLGQPMIDAHLGESRAAPFGVFVHESARGAQFPTTKEGWWRWFENVDKFEREKLLGCLAEYFRWCYSESDKIKYEPERVHVHRGFAEVFFSN